MPEYCRSAAGWSTARISCRRKGSFPELAKRRVLPMPTTAKAWGTDSADAPLKPMQVERRDPRPEDVAIKISHCGICHSDVHFAHNDWGMSQYPMVPGHEIVGTVTGIGQAV